MREYNENADYNLNESFNLQFDKIKFNRVKSKNTIDKSTTLYNLEVSKNRNFNTSVGFAHNGGKRKGSFAIYLEPWHSDILEFIDLRKNHGKEEMRARDLFLALWVPDLFMKRVESDGDWTLFSPDEAPGLSDVYDSPDHKKFTELYTSYEEKGLGRETIKARKLMDLILVAQMETGTPYMLYKDACNYKSNQQNLGTIKSSNLCVAGNTLLMVSILDEEVKMTIESVVDVMKYHDVDILVYSFNHESGINEYKKITNSSLMFENTKVLRITDTITGDFIKCTPNHKIFIDGKGYVEAGSLKNGDKIKSMYGVLYHSIKIEECDELIDVYDITVEDNENFYANNILVHNCSEILQYSSLTEQAVCNLASIALPKFIENNEINHQKLYDSVYQVVRNLNNVIDVNYYPTKETEYSNFKNRPIGIGVQGLADVFCMLGIAFESNEANIIQTDIFETMYFAALCSSNDLSKELGTYESFDGSPSSKGLLQYDLWGKTEGDLSGRWNWLELKEKIKSFGLRNSLNITIMPTASTAQILGNNEAIEPFTSNLYTRRTLGGEFVMINKHLVNNLLNIGLWNDDIKNKIIMENGSIQNIPEIPTNLKEIYKTVWEMSQKTLLTMSANRGIFIDQSQSFNIFMSDPTKSKLLAAHMHGWKSGLKTGMYYLRTKSAVDAIKGLGIKTDKVKEPIIDEELVEKPADSFFECEACGS